MSDLATQILSALETEITPPLAKISLELACKKFGKTESCLTSKDLPEFSEWFRDRLIPYVGTARSEHVAGLIRELHAS